MFLDTTGQEHIWIHRDCYSICNTCTNSRGTKVPEQRRESGLEVLSMAKKVLTLIISRGEKIGCHQGSLWCFEWEISSKIQGIRIFHTQLMLFGKVELCLRTDITERFWELKALPILSLCLLLWLKMWLLSFLLRPPMLAICCPVSLPLGSLTLWNHNSK